MKKCCKNNRLEEGTRIANEPYDFELFFSLSLSLITSVTLLRNQLKSRVNRAKHAQHRDAIFFKNNIERSNIIIIITCSFVIVFIAFNHLYLAVIRTWRAPLPRGDFPL